MAEYDREQRNKLSRTIANSETGSRQLKEIVDNRDANPINLFNDFVIQRLPVLRTGAHSNNNYTPRPIDVNGSDDKLNGLSTYDNVFYLSEEKRVGKHQIIETNNLGPNLKAKKSGRHYAIRPNKDKDSGNRPKLADWVGNTSSEYTNAVFAARVAEIDYRDTAVGTLKSWYAKQTQDIKDLGLSDKAAVDTGNKTDLGYFNAISHLYHLRDENVPLLND